MMTWLTLSALALSAAVYLFVAWRSYTAARTLADHLPMSRTGEAAVHSSKEFSAATVATSISLATVILAYTELAGFFGLWLLWTVLTTTIGLLLLRAAAPVIWRRLNAFGAQRPTLHEFLGERFDSPILPRAAALCTALGFLGALAVELSVGSRFLVGLAPSVPAGPAVALLAAIGVGYTLLGGFRAVVVTDRLQMHAIWATIAVLAALLLWQIFVQMGPRNFAAQVPSSAVDFSWREGLGAFLLGIALINIPTFLGDMAMWQRISGSRDEKTVTEGLTKSTIGAAASWTTLALIACAVAVLSPVKEGANPLAVYLGELGSSGGALAALAFFVIVAGLYAATLSTASTLLMAAGHTLHTDLLRAGHDKTELSGSSLELRVSRILLVAVAAAAVVIVEALQAVGYTISDLVLAVFGAQLGLVPVVLLALFVDNRLTKRIGSYAAVGALAGFASGWLLAGYGKLIGDGNLVFLSPAASLGVSSLICLIGWLLNRGRIVD